MLFLSVGAGGCTLTRQRCREGAVAAVHMRVHGELSFLSPCTRARVGSTLHAVRLLSTQMSCTCTWLYFDDLLRSPWTRVETSSYAIKTVLLRKLLFLWRRWDE